MKKTQVARLLAYGTGMVNQQLLLQNEYLIAENRILRSHLPARLRLTDPHERRWGNREKGPQARDLSPDSRASRIGAVFGTIELLGNQLAIPTQDGLRFRDQGDLLQCLTSAPLPDRGQRSFHGHRLGHILLSCSDLPLDRLKLGY